MEGNTSKGKVGREPEQRGELVMVKEWGRKEVSIESILECNAV